MLTYIYIRKNLKNQNPNRTSLIKLFIFEIKQNPRKLVHLWQSSFRIKANISDIQRY